MTTPQQSWQRVTELFEQALECPRAERSEFLKSAAAGDADLLREVESLLAQHDAETGFLESPAVAVVADQIVEKDEQLLIGKQLGQYRIEALLGRGGMGEVHVAQDKLGRKVALKVLTQRFPGDESGIARFQQEARTLLALNHPHIVTIYDIDQIDGTYYIASELVEGQTLRQRLDEGGLPLHDLLEIGIQVITALTAAHEKGIVHRDIKPENIMIRRDGFVKVLDFGIAKLTEKYLTAESEAQTLKQVQTAEGIAIGTPAYMSPEQARGLKVDARTDIWSLGVLMFEAIAGRKPFAGDTVPDVINAVLEKTPAPLTRYASDVPEAFEWIVSRALRKEKEARYQTANELLADLKELRTKVELAKVTASETPYRATTSGTHATAAGLTAAPAPASSAAYVVNEIKRPKQAVLMVVSALIVIGGAMAFAYFRYFANRTPAITSIAILPFKNESGSSEVEYLSDGMTDMLITGLSELPQLSVKARSSVFRYKGKDATPQQVGKELNVQAILTGRLVQRGNDLTLHVELVDVKTETALWSGDYNRSMTNLAMLQREIARDVSRKLRARLSGADEQKVTRNYTDNAEAYQLYLKGRYHLFRLTRPEIDKAIAYYQQAIALDQSYALAYTGLAQAYRALALTADVPSNEALPKSKAAALRAIEIDETLAEAHAALGVVAYWYDWDWKVAEKHFLRALELNPDSIAHAGYAQLLSSMGQHERALIEFKSARDLEPINLRNNAVEGQGLFFAGKYDESIDWLQKTIDQEPNHWLPHLFLSRVFIEKKMYAEAIAEATKARDLSGGNAEAVGHIVYALAKAGKQAEARTTLHELKKRADAGRHVPPYAFALSYNGLGETDQTMAWLVRGLEHRDVKMVLLTVDPKWNNLRSDARFQDLMRRAGFTS